MYKMLTINNITEYTNLKKYPIQPLCYVYYKDSLLNSYYVGFTTQNIYKYLRNHHKMGPIVNLLNNGFYIKLYKKYDENALINLCKPKLNKNKGSGKLGRKIYNYKPNHIKNVGDIITSKQLICFKNHKTNNSLSPPICETIWDSLFVIDKPIVSSINNYILKYIIEYYKLKNENKKYETITQRIYKDHENMVSKQNTRKYIDGICLILKYCKIKYVFESFILIHQIYIYLVCRVYQPYIHAVLEK